MLLMEGFTNVEVASHGLECVEKMLLFREQALLTWKKWMEINKGDISARQHLGKALHADANDPVIRQRVSHEAQVLTQAMLSEMGCIGSVYESLDIEQRYELLAQAAAQQVAREVDSTVEPFISDRIPKQTHGQLGAAGEDKPGEENEKETAASSASTRSSDIRPLASVAMPTPKMLVPCRSSPLIPKLIFLDLHMPVSSESESAD